MNVQVARILAAVRAVGPRKAVGAGTAIAPLLERLISVMKRLPRGAELDWALRAYDAKLSAPIDPRDLEDLFGNLLDNARKWARTRVDVSVTATSDRIVVAVGDDGPGIPEDRRSEVLSDGVRLDRTVPGTGIGLAIAKDLTTLHRGTLGLETSDLGGIQVTVHLMLRARSTVA